MGAMNQCPNTRPCRVSPRIGSDQTDICILLPPDTSFYYCRDHPEGIQVRCVAAERLDLEVKVISDLMTMSDVLEDVLDIRYLFRYQI